MVSEPARNAYKIRDFSTIRYIVTNTLNGSIEHTLVQSPYMVHVENVLYAEVPLPHVICMVKDL